MNNYLKLKQHILDELAEGDMVLDIKVQKVLMQDWNNLLDYLRTKNNVSYTYASISQPIPSNITNTFFEDEYVRLIKITYNYLTIELPFFDFDEIEFYTSGILNMHEKGFDELFDFVKQLSIGMGRNVSIHLENLLYPIIEYDFIKLKFQIFHVLNQETAH